MDKNYKVKHSGQHHIELIFTDCAHVVLSPDVGT
jgi:hypothetical protein